MGRGNSRDLDRDRLDGVARLELLGLVHSRGHRPEPVVDGRRARVRPWRLLEEELAAVHSAPGHSRHAHRIKPPRHRAGFVEQVVTWPSAPVSSRIAALHHPVLSLPEGEAVVVAVNREHYEVVHGRRGNLRMQLDDDGSLRRVDSSHVSVLWVEADRLTADELMRCDLDRRLAAGERCRDLGGERSVDRESCSEHRGNQDGDDQDRHPWALAPRLGQVGLVDLYGRSRPARRLPDLHFRAADSLIACTSPCVVYSRATIETVRPSLRATSAVTGPIHAISASPRTAGRRSSWNAWTKLTTVDELVKVITSTPSLLNRRSRASPVPDGHMARYTGRISTSAPRLASSDGSESRATSARGTRTCMPFISQPSSALASPSAVYSEVISSGRSPWRSSDSAVSWPIAQSFEPCRARASAPDESSI